MTFIDPKYMSFEVNESSMLASLTLNCLKKIGFKDDDFYFSGLFHYKKPSWELY